MLQNSQLKASRSEFPGEGDIQMPFLSGVIFHLLSYDSFPLFRFRTVPGVTHLDDLAMHVTPWSATVFAQRYPPKHHYLDTSAVALRTGTTEDSRQTRRFLLLPPALLERAAVPTRSCQDHVVAPSIRSKYGPAGSSS